MRASLGRFGFALVATLVGLVALTGIAFAHDHREVGHFALTVGWTGEPAYEGEKNGVDFRIADHDTNAPITGAETTVQVEITYVPTKKTVTKALRAVFNSPGRYTADVLPTAAGVYQFRFFGKINDTGVNETFVSEGGGGHFSDIEPIGDLQFPEKLAAAREMEGAARGAQAAATEAADTASSAVTLAYVGIALGVIGIIVGAGGLMMGRRGK